MKRTFLTFLVIVLAAAWSAGISSAGVRQQDSTPIPPLEPITAANADRIERLATLEGEWITQIAWSPNGKTLAAATPAGLWLHKTDNLDAAPRLLGEDTDWVENVVWSPDGTMLASGGDDIVRVWDMASGEQLHILEGHVSYVASVAWSPDGAMLASGGWDYRVQLWDAASGEPLRLLEGHTGNVFSVAWSPDGTQLASGSEDGTLRVWDAASGAQLRLLQEPPSSLINFSVTWSPDGTMLAVGGDDGMIRLWDAATGELLRVLEGHTDFVYSVAWSPDGTLLASASEDGTVRVWDAAMGTQLSLLEEHTDAVNSVAWSPDGTILASGGTDSTIRLWGVPVGGLPHDALAQPEGLPEFGITVDTVQAPTECTPSGWTSTYNRTTTISDLDASTLMRYFVQYVNNDLNFVHYWDSGYSAYVQDYWISAGTQIEARVVGDYTIPLQNDTYQAESIEYILQADEVIWEVRAALTCENGEIVAYEITSRPVQDTRDALPEFTQNLVLALDDIPLYGNPYAQADYYGTIKAGQTFFITSIYRPRASISVWAQESVTGHDIMIFDGSKGLPIVDVAEDYGQQG